MRTFRAVVTSTLACCVPLVLFAGYGQASAEPLIPGGAKPVSSPGQPTNVNGAAPVADAIASYLTRTAPAIFAGTVLTNRGNDLTVYVTKHLPALETAALHLNVAKVPVQFKTAPLSQVSLMSNHVAFTAKVPALLASGVKVSTWAPDPTTGTERVLVVSPSTAAISAQTRVANTAKVKGAIGALGGTVNVETIPAAWTPIAYANRFTDFSPWNAGNFSTDGDGDCTLGYAAHNSAHKYIVTAGHCYAVGESIFEGSTILGMGNGSTIGKVSSADTAVNGTDSELISAIGSGGIWTGVTGGTAGSPVNSTITGAHHATIGEQVCADGAFDGTECGGTVLSTSLCSTQILGHQVCNLTYVTSSNNGEAGPGDSGGPVYELIGGKIYITGTITGSGSSPNGFPVQPQTTCQLWITQTRGDRKCSHDYVFTDVTAELARYGLTIN